MNEMAEMAARWRALANDPNSGLDEYYALALISCADELEAAIPAATNQAVSHDATSAPPAKPHAALQRAP